MSSKVAGVLFILPDGNVVVHRRDNKTKISPGLLALFGGWVEEGENYLQAIKREVKEETSLNPDNINFVELTDLKFNIDGPKIFRVFTANINDANFEVFEGEGLEIHEPKKLIEYKDISGSLKFALKIYNGDK